jgi:hypothetical protein
MNLVFLSSSGSRCRVNNAQQTTGEAMASWTGCRLPSPEVSRALLPTLTFFKVGFGGFENTWQTPQRPVIIGVYTICVSHTV